MKCADIPDRPILDWLNQRGGAWATWFRGFENSVPFPSGTPDKLIIAKMAGLIRRGLVDGCSCGCRGDDVITAKGKAELQREVRFVREEQP